MYVYGCFQKFTPKWMVYFRENLLKIDDSGGFYPLFSENILGFDGRVSASLLLFDLKHACSTWRQSQKHPGRRPAETGKKKLHPKQVPKMTTKMRTLGNVDVFIYLYIYCYWLMKIVLFIDLFIYLLVYSSFYLPQIVRICISYHIIIFIYIYKIDTQYIQHPEVLHHHSLARHQWGEKLSNPIVITAWPLPMCAQTHRKQ